MARAAGLLEADHARAARQGAGDPFQDHRLGGDAANRGDPLGPRDQVARDLHDRRVTDDATVMHPALQVVDPAPGAPDRR